MDPEFAKFRSAVNRMLARGDIDLPVVDATGSHPVVFALAEDRLFTLLGRLRNMGGYANVFVKCGDGIRRVSVMDARSAIPIPDDDMSGEPPGPMASVGMFLDYLALRPNGVVLSVVNPVGPAVARELALT